MIKIANKQDVLTFEQQPLPTLASSVYQVIADSANEFADRTALQFFFEGNNYDTTVAFTYAELLAKIHATANMFRDLGIDDTGVVTYMLPNLPETLFSVYGGETAGIVNAVNPMLDSEHIIDIMNAAGSKILVTLAPFPNNDLWEKANRIIPNVSSLEVVLTINLGSYIGLSSQEIKGHEKVRVLDFHKTIEKYPTNELTFYRTIKRTDIASYFHTGGTTGKPKIAQHTHDNEVFNAWVLEKQLALNGPRVFFCGLPWFHVNGVIVTGLMPLTGGHTILIGSPSGYRGEGVITNFWKIVDHYKVSFFSCVPTVLQMLLSVPKADENISSLEFALCGAAPLSMQLFNDFEKVTGIKILEGYGFTEGACANSGNPAYGERKVGSIGLPNIHHKMKVVILNENKDYERDAEVDEIGVIVARGRNVFPGYKEAIHNENIFIDDGLYKWYNTGDLGREDEDGFFWLTGRKKELIIRGGHNIDPKSIEEPLSKHPAVAAVAAVARPDKKVGELPAVYVQLKPNQTVSIGALSDYAKENIRERAAVPKFIAIIEQLPLTAVGKIFKPALAQRQIKEVFEKELSALASIKKANIIVIQHPKKGVVAQIEATPSNGITQNQIKNVIRKALGGYTVKYDIIEKN